MKMIDEPRIYMLHRVIEHYDQSNYYFQRKTAISWKKFIELLDIIESKGWKTQPISKLLNNVSNKDVFITFDDGYQDNSKALDELIKRGMTATVFPVKDFILTSFSPIDDMAHHLMLIKKVNNELLQSLLTGRLKRVMRGVSVARYRYYRKKWFGIDVDADNRDLFLRVKQLKHYCSQGIELGIHGGSHRAFTHLSSSELNSEFTDCLSWLKSLGNTTMPSICFPHGKHNDYVVKQSLNISKILLGVESTNLLIPVLKRIHITEEYDG